MLPPVNMSFRVSSNIVRNPSTLADNLKEQQKLELDQHRIAIKIVQRMREAGISCELSSDLQQRH
jgi:hypothetical protein